MVGVLNFRRKHPFKLREQLIGAFVAVGLLVAVVGATGIYTALGMQHAFDNIVEQATPRLQALLEIQIAAVEIEAQSVAFERIGRQSDQAEGSATARLKNELLATMEKIDKWIASYRRHLNDAQPEAGHFSGDIGEAKDAVIQYSLELTALKEQGLEGRAVAAKAAALRAAQQALKTTVRAAVDMEMRDLGALREKAHQNAAALRRTNILLSMTAVFIALGIGVLIARWIAGPLALLVHATAAYAKGQWDHRVAIDSGNEIGDLARAFDHMAQDLKQSQEEMKKANGRVMESEKISAVGQLAAGVAHEINNPLGVILGFAEAIARRIPKDDPLEMPLKSIEREAMRCRNLVQDLLTFSRTSKVEREPIDLNHSVEASLSLIQAQARVARCTIATALDPALPRIFANQNQMQQIVINLAKNAMDAMEEGGKVMIKTERLTRAGKMWVCLTIEDTGSGISPANLSKIFDPFFTTKPVGKGTGLGLSLVHEIVNKHGGVIDVQSHPGLTQFLIQFPGV